MHDPSPHCPHRERIARRAAVLSLHLLWQLSGTGCGSGPTEFDVRDFGAYTDGSGEVVPAVARAVEAAAAAGGGVVRFPPGTYRWNATLRIDHPGITLAGSGRSVLQATGTVQTMIRVEGTHHVSIRDLAFAGVPEGTRGITVQLRGCTDCEVRNCQFDRIGTSTLDVTDGSERCRLVGNQIRNAPGHAIMISGYAGPGDPARGSRSIEVLANTIFRPGNTGISVEVRNENVLVRGNHIIEANRNRALYSDGIAVFNGTMGYEIVDNVIIGTHPSGAIDTGNGILLGQGELREPPRNGIIRDNLLIGNGREHRDADCASGGCMGNGIFTAFPDAGPTTIDTVVEGNLVYRSGRSGVSVGDALGLAVRGNVLAGNGNHGIWLRTTTTGARVVDNTVWANANHGLRIDSTGNRVRENWSGDNGLSGIFLGSAASENDVSENTVAGNDRASFGHAGIFLEGNDSAGASRNRMEQNRIEDAAGLVIRAAGCRANVLRGNWFPGSVEGGIRDAGSGTIVESAAIAGDDPPTASRSGPGCSAATSRGPSHAGDCRLVVLDAGAELRVLPATSASFLQIACDGAGGVMPQESDGLILLRRFDCTPGASLFLENDGDRWREVARVGG